MKKLERKNQLDQIAKRVIEEIEDRGISGLKCILVEAQKIYLEKLTEAGINIDTCPVFIDIRNQRLFFFSSLMVLYLVPPVLATAFNPSENALLLRSDIEALLIGFGLIVTSFLYFFFYSPLKQLKRLLSISNRKILKQLNS